MGILGLIVEFLFEGLGSSSGVGQKIQQTYDSVKTTVNNQIDEQTDKIRGNLADKSTDQLKSAYDGSSSFGQKMIEEELENRGQSLD